VAVSCNYTNCIRWPALKRFIPRPIQWPCIPIHDFYNAHYRLAQQDCAMPPHSVENAFIQFSGNSGYSRHGDTVSLYADRIDNQYNCGFTSGSLALQLWACQAPYNGGSLTGWKLAESKLGILEANHFIAPVKADVPSHFPEHGDYAIVLVIAEWDGEDFNLIHDYHNYPCRDVFLHPRL
jgi:hypothetical protein